MSAPILITGGARRFGRALALDLAGAGYDVAITYRQSNHDLDALVAAGVDCIQTDLGSPHDCQQFISLMEKRYRALRAIVHNASEWLPESENADLATVMQRNMAIHVQTPYLINSGLESLLMAGAEKYGMADIIHLTDYVAARGSQKHIAYAASKAALHNLTLSFASKLAPHIKVNSIAPALLMFRDEDDAAYKEKVARKSLLPPGPGADEGIRAVTMLLDSHYMTGQTIALDGGRHLKAG